MLSTQIRMMIADARYHFLREPMKLKFASPRYRRPNRPPREAVGSVISGLLRAQGAGPGRHGGVGRPGPSQFAQTGEAWRSERLRARQDRNERVREQEHDHEVDD